jgi:hypothetical protein
MTAPASDPAISTAMVAAIGKCEAFQCGRDFGVWPASTRSAVRRGRLDDFSALNQRHPLLGPELSAP